MPTCANAPRDPVSKESSALDVGYRGKMGKDGERWGKMGKMLNEQTLSGARPWQLFLKKEPWFPDGTRNQQYGRQTHMGPHIVT